MAGIGRATREYVTHPPPWVWAENRPTECVSLIKGGQPDHVDEAEIKRRESSWIFHSEPRLIKTFLRGTEESRRSITTRCVPVYTESVQIEYNRIGQNTIERLYLSLNVNGSAARPHSFRIRNPRERERLTSKSSRHRPMQRAKTWRTGALECSTLWSAWVLRVVGIVS